MKLIDILVSSGDGMSLFGLRTKYLAMDPDGRVYGYTEMPTPGIIGWSVPDNLYSTDGRGCLIQIDRDDVDGQWQYAIITREQYEAALAEKEHPLPWEEKNKPCPTLGAECRGCPDCGLRVSCTSDDITDDAVRAEMGMNSRTLDAALAAKNDGWIEWGGGECPVNPSEMVDVIFGRGGRVSTNIADCWRWNHSGTDSDIIAYRLHKPQEEWQNKADDEADLNECIGHDAAPIWNGEGLPPVGCECECQFGGEWQKCTILFSGKQIVVVMVGDDEYPFESKGSLFRPIRSESDRKRDEAVKAIMLTGWCQTAAEEIYDLVAAGKVPGIKLED